MQQLFFYLMEAFHVLYNAQLDDKCGNELKELCRNTDHLFIGQEDKHMEIWNNIAIHISSLVMHDLTVDMHTFSPFPYHIRWHKYEVHVA